MKKISVLAVCAMMILVVGCSKELKVTIKDNIGVEYGDKLDNSILFDKEQSDEGIAVKEVKNFDAKKTGEQEITVIFTNEDEKTKEETIKVSVKDTKKPVIKLKKEKVEITAGDKFDAASNIESVKDPIDGDIKKSDDKELTKDGYIITSDVKADKTGEYTVKITAYDVNGNKAEQSYKVTVKEKPKEPDTPVNTPTNNNQSNTGGNQSSNGGGSSTSGGNGNASGGNTAQEKPHYRTDISNTYFSQINAWRKQNGLEPLPHNATTQAEADKRAMELVSNYGHASSYGFGENIGHGTAGYDFFQAWKASPGHNGAMLEKRMFIAMDVILLKYNCMLY